MLNRSLSSHKVSPPTDNEAILPTLYASRPPATSATESMGEGNITLPSSASQPVPHRGFSNPSPPLPDQPNNNNNALETGASHPVFQNSPEERHSLAVIPFHRPHSPKAANLNTAPHHSSTFPQHSSAPRASRSGFHLPHTASTDGSEHTSPHRSASVPIPVQQSIGALVQICPTCHRPLDAPFSNVFDAPPHNKFTPHYFRQLPILGPPPLLAIEDVHHHHEDGNVSNVSTTPNSGRLLIGGASCGTALPAPTTSPPRDRFLRSTTTSLPNSNATTPRGRGGRRSRRSSVTGGEGRRSRRQSVGLDVQPGVYSYVSPTTTAEPDGDGRGAALGDGGSADPYVDADLLELLEKHQAKIRGTSAHKEDEEVVRDAWAEEEDIPVEPEKPKTYYEQYFLESKKLGSGTFGGVYLCMHVMEGVPLGTFALKKIPVGDDIAYLQNVLREVRILEEVKRHPNVIEYNHSWVDVAKMADFGPPVRCLFILMEYANEGSLESYLERRSTVLSTMAVWYFFLSAVAGTTHLHQKNILHRDLKPQNLLLSARSVNAPPRVLVSDFGTAALLGERPTNRTGGTGTLEYMAPELFIRDPTAPPEEEVYLHGHTKSSDVWSLGMILHYLACGTALPKRTPTGNIILDVSGMSPVPRPPEMVELIRAMLQMDPKKRPTCKDIMRSTVVQTLLSSFNNTPFTAMDLFSPLYDPMAAQLGPEDLYTDDSDESVGEEVLESSRVELLSTLAVGNPLLQQYENQERSANITSPSTAGVPFSPSNTLRPTQPTSPKGKQGHLNSLVVASSNRKVRPGSPPSRKPPTLARTGSPPRISAMPLARSLVTPTAKRFVDASVQTDPVTIL